MLAPERARDGGPGGGRAAGRRVELGGGRRQLPHLPGAAALGAAPGRRQRHQHRGALAGQRRQRLGLPRRPAAAAPHPAGVLRGQPRRRRRGRLAPGLHPLARLRGAHPLPARGGHARLHLRRPLHPLALVPDRGRGAGAAVAGGAPGAAGDQRLRRLLRRRDGLHDARRLRAARLHRPAPDERAEEHARGAAQRRGGGHLRRHPQRGVGLRALDGAGRRRGRLRRRGARPEGRPQEGGSRGWSRWAGG